APRPPAAPPAPPGFDAARAWRHLERLVAIGPRAAGTPGGRAAQELIAAELAARGLAPVREEFVADTPLGPLPLANVWAEAPGAARPGGAPAPIVVLASHFDTKRLPFAFVGANDGGSGVAVLLELARGIAADPARRAVSYRFLFTDGEEAVRREWVGDDNTYGARHHVAARRSDGTLDRIAACVVLDLVGDRDLGLIHELGSSPELVALFFSAARRIGLGAVVGAGSREIEDDHLPFLAAGIPSVDLIDFDFGPRHSWWHSERDVLAACSPASLEAVGRIVLAGLPDLEEWILAR
ncbi:MAG: M28 family peptidase, partial [Planctomycetota bacterium]